MKAYKVMMKKNFLLYGAVLLSALSCRTTLNVAGIRAEKNISITAGTPEKKELNAVIAPYKAELEGKMNAVISHTAVDLTKSGDNSNLGNLLADFTFNGANEWALKNNLPPVDAAVINIGGIRSTIGSGNILAKHIYEVMPFENEVVIVKLKGRDLHGLFDYYAKTLKNNPVSKIYAETNVNSTVKALINGSPIAEDKPYYIATSDYLALGGDNMVFFSKGEMISTGLKLRDVFMEQFRKMPEVKVSDDVRLVFKNKKQNND